MLPRLDLNLLRTLDAVLSTRNVARAAERLHVTPPAVSNALARLRREFNDPLVVRSGRGIVPTPRALALAPALRDALSRLELAVRSESFDPATTTRRFTLALSGAGQISFLPKLGSLMAVEMPGASLRVIGIDTLLSWGGVASAEVDAAIGRFDEDVPGVLSCSLYEERSVLVARRGHAIARRRLTRARLRPLRHVDVEVAPGRGYRGLDESYAGLGIQRTVAMLVPSFVAAAAIVAKTDWVATLPVGLVESFKTQYGLVVLEGEAPTQRTPLSLVWHDRTEADAASKALRALITRAIGRPLEG
jgi:DNA-binding transcriptional LysR family regulator